MRLAVALVLMAAATACGAASPGSLVSPSPSASSTPIGSPLTAPQLTFAVIDTVGKPAFCDPDFYPVGSEEREQANAIATYPEIKADTQTFAAIVAHEGLPSAGLSDQQKLILYRAWKVLQHVILTPSGGGYSFGYVVVPSGGHGYQKVLGTVRVDGTVTVSSQTASGAPICPICLAASTLIATPYGPLPVTSIHVGTVVWTESSSGQRLAEPVIKVGSMAVPPEHRMVHVMLADGRALLASPGHRTADGRPLGGLNTGDSLDGSTITLWELVPYAGGRTYDLLPAGDTGHYWANGIELSSTLVN